MQEHNRILQFFPDELCTALKNYLTEKAKNAEADCAERNDLAQMDSAEKTRLRNEDQATSASIESDYQKGRNYLNHQQAEEMTAAQKRRDAWLQAMDAYHTRVQAARGRVEWQLSYCAYDQKNRENPLADANQIPQRLPQNGKAEVLSILKEESEGLSQKTEDYNQPLLQMDQKAEELTTRAETLMGQVRSEAEQEYGRETSAIRTKYREKNAELDKKHGTAVEKWKTTFAEKTKQQREAAQKRTQEQRTASVQRAEALDDRFRKNFVEQLQPEKVQAAYQAVRASLPQYKGYTPVKESLGGLIMGDSQTDITSYMEDLVVRECMEKHCAFALRQEGDKSYLVLPHAVSFTDSAFSSIIGYNAATRDAVVSNLNAMTLQLFMTNVAGKVRFTFISPSDAGEAFASFMRFADVDERLVDTHVWGNSQRIEERLDVLLDRAQTINQDYLRGQYADILEYNQAAGKNAEPLQFLMVVDFPRGFTQAALEKLENIMSNGPKNGIYTILAGEVGELDGSNDANDPRYNAVLQRIVQHLSRYRYENGMLCVPPRPSSAIRAGHPHANPQVQYLPLQLPENRVELDDAIETMKKAVYNADRVTITYDDVTSGLTHQPDRWFRYSDEKGISVPFALSGANKVLSLELASDALSPKYHTLVTGMIGSGKSTLLHTLIMGLLMKYSPEDVQIYLMDFKDGVEFKVYTEYNLKNFRAISIDTEPEFGLAVLKKIEAEMQARNNIFKQEGCRGLEGYRREMAEKGNPHHGMPRTILIIDEFQEAFGRSDDPVMSEAAEIIKRLTLVGRAPAIYLIMATQDIKNAAALPETVYNQFETRIALKSSPDSARIILPDNPMADQLINLDKGVAIFNASAGNKDHNVQCRIAFCSEDEQRALLEQIAQKQAAADFQVTGGTRLLLSSIQDDRSNPLNHFEETGEIDQNDMSLGYRLFVGEPLSLENNFHPQLLSCRGKNLLLTGNDQQRARITTAFIMGSLLYETLRQQDTSTEPAITLFDLSSDAPQDDMFGQLVRGLPEKIRVYHAGDVLDGLDMLEKELPVGRRQFVVFFGLNRARRLLIQPDAYTQAPREKFVSLLQRGPENNMSFIVWANSAENFLSLYRDVLPCFEQRLVGGIPEEQLAELIIGQAPANMKPKNAVYFDMDATETPKIRLYDQPTDSWMRQFIRRLQDAIRAMPQDSLW